MPAWAADLFRVLAVPRFHGTETLAAVTDAVARRLEEWGYRVERQPFRTSARRLTAASLGAHGLGWIAILLTPLLVLPVAGWIVALLAVGLVGLVAVLAHAIAEGYVPVGLPEGPGENVIATMSAEPRWWIVAHLDSKSQRFSLRGRILAVLAVVVGTASLGALLAVRLAGPVAWPPAFAAAAVVIAGAAVLAAGAPGNRSPGAVDNASGVIAALAAAEALAGRPDVGVLLTGAEELGMEGARRWCRTGPASGAFVNFDGLDGRGAFRVMRHRGCEPAPARLLADTLGALGRPVRVGSLPPGVLVDGSVLARHGLAGVTLSCGDWTTLGRVHTAGDVPERVELGAAIDAGRAVARWLSMQPR